jgi:DNA polymerase-1
MEFTNALKALGIRRQSMNLHHAVACRAPDNDLDKVMLKWQRENKKREKAGLEPVPSPIECCRPRLINELGDAYGVVALGKTAYQSITRKAKSILEIRGGPVVGWLNTVGDFVDGEMPTDAPLGSSKINVLPTLHPAFVIRTRRWSRAFKSDLSRAQRWFTTGTLGWVEPKITINPKPSELREFLRRTDIDYAVDVETSIDDPTVADLRTVGVGHESAAMVVVLKSIETGQPVYPSHEDAEIREVLRTFFEDRDKVKVAHNGGYFDRMVIKNHFGVDPKPMMDTILLHRSVESELPHKLAYVGSIYTDVTAWKEAHTATEAKTDHELAHYNAIDCVVTARAAPKLSEAAYLRGQGQVVQRDHRVQQVCVGLHENGMFVDRRARDIVARELITKMGLYRADAQMICGRPNMNLNSVPQLRDLLFTDWNLQPADYTKLGDPSTNDECVRIMRSANKENEQVVKFLDALRRYRKVAKEYGTYVRRLIPYGQPLDGYKFQTEDEEEEAERGLIMADGRVRPDYNAHGTTSGRLSSSSPNAQNWPKHLRKLIIPAPGNVIVGADADQLELRIITAIAKIAVYLEAFDQKKDPHAMTAALMFGKKFTELVPKSDLWDKLRKIAKSIKYASFYGSGDETVHGLVTSAEDDNGNLMYPDLTLREVSTLKRNWLKGIPELPRWWEDTMDEYKSAGYVLDPVWGRRRDFLDGEAFNEIVNHPIQSAGAHIIHESTFDLLEEIPFEKWGPGTGLISQVHDALYVECPESEAEWVAKTIEKHMNRKVKGLDGVVFSAKAKAGKNWGEV